MLHIVSYASDPQGRLLGLLIWSLDVTNLS